MSLSPRTLWRAFEAVHAVVYFAPEVRDAYRAMGLKGFWMGYFAGRSAPFGIASAELVTATFFNFEPAMVARAIPDAWAYATPAEVLAARERGIDAALQRLLGTDVDAPTTADAAGLLREALAGCSLAGRPLFAAGAALDWPVAPHLQLWHAATLLREHRGDGHVAANLAHGFDGLAAHIMACASGAVPREAIQPHRGWTDDQWDGAMTKLVARGLVDANGTLTGAGREARAVVEHVTDELAREPWDHLGTEATARAHELLVSLAARTVVELPFPNPMGLPPPEPTER
jgi:hypothetical protein